MFRQFDISPGVGVLKLTLKGKPVSGAGHSVTTEAQCRAHGTHQHKHGWQLALRLILLDFEVHAVRNEHRLADSRAAWAWKNMQYQ